MCIQNTGFPPLKKLEKVRKKLELSIFFYTTGSSISKLN